jgi:hypothetical protein
MVDTYTTAGDRGQFTVCWTIPSLVNDCITVTSSSQGTISKPITLQKSTSGFQFRVVKARRKPSILRENNDNLLCSMLHGRGAMKKANWLGWPCVPVAVLLRIAGQ